MILNDTHSDAKVGLNIALLHQVGFIDSSWGNDETASFWHKELDATIYVNYTDERSVLDKRFYAVKWPDSDNWVDGSFDTLQEAVDFCQKVGSPKMFQWFEGGEK